MVKKKSFVPDKGDVVWLTFDPQSGHEQRGRRPALVISPIEYNKKTNLAIFVPITSKIKNYPFEVRLESKIIEGVVLSDQIKSLDWNIRNAEFIEKASKSIMNEVISNIEMLIN